MVDGAFFGQIPEPCTPSGCRRTHQIRLKSHVSLQLIVQVRIRRTTPAEIHLFQVIENITGSSLTDKPPLRSNTQWQTIGVRSYSSKFRFQIRMDGIEQMGYGEGVQLIGRIQKLSNTARAAIRTMFASCRAKPAILTSL